MCIQGFYNRNYLADSVLVLAVIGYNWFWAESLSCIKEGGLALGRCSYLLLTLLSLNIVLAVRPRLVKCLVDSTATTIRRCLCFFLCMQSSCSCVFFVMLGLFDRLPIPA